MRWWIKGIVAVAAVHGANAHAQGRAAPLEKRDYFLAKCERPTGDWSSTCLGYLSGLLDMYQGQLAFMSDINPWKDFCIPRGATLDTIQQLLFQRIRAGKTDPALDTSHVLLDALKEKYPCPYLRDGKPNPRYQGAR
jgi:Rap1a immunity proteins